MHYHLERLIKQKAPFKSPYNKAEIGIYLLANLMNNEKQKLFKEFGITFQQYNLLRILRGQFPKATNINLLKERMLDRMSDTSRIVDRLAKMNLVTKEPNLIDKRNTDVLITEKGLDLLTQIELREDFHQNLLSEFHEDEIEILNELIDKALAKIE